MEYLALKLSLPLSSDPSSFAALRQGNAGGVLNNGDKVVESDNGDLTSSGHSHPEKYEFISSALKRMRPSSCLGKSIDSASGSVLIDSSFTFTFFTFKDDCCISEVNVCMSLKRKKYQMIG